MVGGGESCVREEKNPSSVFSDWGLGIKLTKRQTGENSYFLAHQGLCRKEAKMPQGSG
jgi:hypothetical protein